MKLEYRVTKYDPVFRDSSGRYTREEWTDFSDVGRRIAGRKLTMRQYLAVESSYLTVLAAMLEEAGVTQLRVEALECARRGRARWREGAIVTAARAIDFARGALRNEVWGKLVAPRRAFVHFGWDLYMYVGLSRPTPGALNLAAQRGMFVESLRSPYATRRRRRAA
jgi:hypothetical protein